MNKKISKTQALFVGGATVITLLIGIPAFAATTNVISSAYSGRFIHKGTRPVVIGTVSAINGPTLTVTTSKGTAYSVDATNASIEKGFGKNETTLALSNIAVNDMVAVQGTVSGNSVTATTVHDGIPVRTATARRSWYGSASQNASFGTVANVDGSTFTLTHKTKTGTSTVTITTTGATTYKKNGQVDTAGDLAVGQRVVVMGTKDSSGNVASATSVNIMVRTPHVAPSNASQS